MDKRTKVILEEADKLFMELGAKESFEEFMNSQKVDEKIRKHFKECKDAVRKIASNAPEVLHEKAERYLMSVYDQEENFKLDVLINFKKHIFSIVFAIKDFSGSSDITKAIFMNNLKNDCGEPLMKYVDEHASEIAELIVKDYMQAVYEDYIPEGLPKEISDFLKYLSNDGVFIPATAIFPEMSDTSILAEIFGADENEV